MMRVVVVVARPQVLMGMLWEADRGPCKLFGVTARVQGRTMSRYDGWLVLVDLLHVCVCFGHGFFYVCNWFLIDVFICCVKYYINKY